MKDVYVVEALKNGRKMRYYLSVAFLAAVGLVSPVKAAQPPVAAAIASASIGVMPPVAATAREIARQGVGEMNLNTDSPPNTGFYPDLGDFVDYNNLGLLMDGEVNTLRTGDEICLGAPYNLALPPRPAHANIGGYIWWSGGDEGIFDQSFWQIRGSGNDSVVDTNGDGNGDPTAIWIQANSVMNWYGAAQNIFTYPIVLSSNVDLVMYGSASNLIGNSTVIPSSGAAENNLYLMSGGGIGMTVRVNNFGVLRNSSTSITKDVSAADTLIADNATVTNSGHSTDSSVHVLSIFSGNVYLRGRTTSGYFDANTRNAENLRGADLEGIITPDATWVGLPTNVLNGGALQNLPAVGGFLPLYYDNGARTFSAPTLVISNRYSSGTQTHQTIIYKLNPWIYSVGFGIPSIMDNSLFPVADTMSGHDRSTMEFNNVVATTPNPLGVTDWDTGGANAFGTDRVLPNMVEGMLTGMFDGAAWCPSYDPRTTQTAGTIDLPMDVGFIYQDFRLGSQYMTEGSANYKYNLEQAQYRAGTWVKGSAQEFLLQRNSVLQLSSWLSLQLTSSTMFAGNLVIDSIGQRASTNVLHLSGDIADTNNYELVIPVANVGVDTTTSRATAAQGSILIDKNTLTMTHRNALGTWTEPMAQELWFRVGHYDDSNLRPTGINDEFAYLGIDGSNTSVYSSNEAERRVWTGELALAAGDLMEYQQNRWVDSNGDSLYWGGYAADGTQTRQANSRLARPVSQFDLAATITTTTAWDTVYASTGLDFDYLYAHRNDPLAIRPTLAAGQLQRSEDNRSAMLTAFNKQEWAKWRDGNGSSQPMQGWYRTLVKWGLDNNVDFSTLETTLAGKKILGRDADWDNVIDLGNMNKAQYDDFVTKVGDWLNGTAITAGVDTAVWTRRPTFVQDLITNDTTNQTVWEANAGDRGTAFTQWYANFRNWCRDSFDTPLPTGQATAMQVDMSLTRLIGNGTTPQWAAFGIAGDYQNILTAADFETFVQAYKTWLTANLAVMTAAGLDVSGLPGLVKSGNTYVIDTALFKGDGTIDYSRFLEDIDFRLRSVDEPRIYIGTGNQLIIGPRGQKWSQYTYNSTSTYDATLGFGQQAIGDGRVRMRGTVLTIDGTGVVYVTGLTNNDEIYAGSLYLSDMAELRFLGDGRLVLDGDYQKGLWQNIPGILNYIPEETRANSKFVMGTSAIVNWTKANLGTGALQLNRGVVGIEIENGPRIYDPDQMINNKILDINPLNWTLPVVIGNNSSNPADILLEVYSDVDPLLIDPVYGAGIVNINTANFYSGGTLIRGDATVRINNPKALGTGLVVIDSGQSAFGSANGGGAYTYAYGTSINGNLINPTISASAIDPLTNRMRGLQFAFGDGIYDFSNSISSTTRFITGDGAGRLLETAGHNTLAVVVLDNNLGNGTSPASTTVKLSADNSGFYGLWMVKRGQLQISNELALGFDRTWNIATVNHPDNAEVYIWDEGRVILTPDSTTVSNNPWLIDNRFLSLADDGVTLRPYTNLRNDSEAHGSLVIQGTGNDTSVSLAGDNTSFYGHIQVLRGNLIFERPTAQGQGDIEIGANGTVRFRVNIAAGTPFANPVWSIGNDIFGEGDLHIDYVDHAFASRFNSATWNAAGNGTRAANDPTMGKVKLNNNNNLSDTHRLSGKVWLDKGILELGHPDAAGIGEISLAALTTLEIHNVLEDSAVVTLQDQPYGNYSDDWTSWVESTYATTTNDAWELDNYITGAGQIVKDQHGILQIGSATREVNTYSGGTMISDGVVRTVGSQALGSGAVTMNSGMLDLYNTNLNLAGLQGAGGIVWLRGWENADPIFPAIKPVEAGRTLTINVANAATTYLFQGFITDRSSLTDLTDYVVRPDLVSGTNLGGNLVKNGAGSFVLNSANDFTGLVTISGGTLEIRHVNALGPQKIGLTPREVRFDGASNLTLNTYSDSSWVFDMLINEMPGSNKSGRLIKDGPGSLTLSNNGNCYTGGVDINQGAIVVTAENALGAMLPAQDGSWSQVTLTDGTQRLTGTVRLMGNTTLEFQPGSGSNWLLENSLAATGAVPGSAATVKLASGKLTLSGNNQNLAGTVNIVISEGAILESVSNTGLGGASIDNRGSLILANGYDRDINNQVKKIGGGLWTAADAVASRASAKTLSGDAVTPGTFFLNCEEHKVTGITYYKDLEHNDWYRLTGVLGTGGTLTYVATPPATTPATLIGSVTLDAAYFMQSDATWTQAIGNSISGIGNLLKIGDGTLIVSGNNSYQGGTFIQGGIVATNHGNALGDMASGKAIVEIGFDGEGETAAGLRLDADLNLNSLKMSSLSLLSLQNRTLTIFEIGLGNLGSSIQGMMRSVAQGKLVKTGAGDLFISNIDTSEFSGSIDVKNGMLSVVGAAGHIVDLSGATFMVTDDLAIGSQVTRLVGNNQVMLGQVTLGGAGAFSGSWLGTVLQADRVLLEGPDTAETTSLEVANVTTVDGSILRFGLATEVDPGWLAASLKITGGDTEHPATLTINPGILSLTAYSSDDSLVSNLVPWKLLDADKVLFKSRGTSTSESTLDLTVYQPAADFKPTNSLYTGSGTDWRGWIKITEVASETKGAGLIKLGTNSILEMVRGDFSGTITGNSILVKSGEATDKLTLSGINAYTGTTEVWGGELVAASAQALGSSNIIISLAGVVSFDTGSDDWSTALQLGTIDNTAGGTIRKIGTGSMTINDPLNIAAGSNPFEIQEGKVVVRDGTWSATDFSNVKIFNGAWLEFKADNENPDHDGLAALSLAGGTVIDAGSLSFDGYDARLNLEGNVSQTGGTLRLVNNAEVLGNGFIYTINGGALWVDDSVGLDLSSISMTSGSLTMDYDSNQVGLPFPIAGSAYLTKLGAGELTLTLAEFNSYSGGTTIGSELVVGGKVIVVPDSPVLPDPQTNGPLTILNGTFDMRTNLTIGDTAASRLSGAAAGRILMNGKTLTVFQNVDGDFNGLLQIGSGVSGTGQLIKEGLAKLTLSGANTYAGGTQINAGWLMLKGIGSAGTGSIVVAVDSVLELNANGTFANAISGAGSLVKSGTGSISLTGSNGYAGGTTIEAGILAQRSVSALGAVGGALAVNGGTLDMDYDLEVGTLSGGASGRIQLDGRKLKVNQALGADTVFAGTFINGVNSQLTLTGGGRLTLSGSNAYTGGTVLETGTTLVTGNASALGTGALSIVSGGILDLDSNLVVGSLSGDNLGVIQLDYQMTVNQSATATFAGTISGAGSLVKAGSGTLTLSADNSYSGGTDIEAGILVQGSALALGLSGPLTVNGGTLDMNFDLAAGTLSGKIAGKIKLNNHNLTITQAGTAKFAGTLTDGTGSLLTVTGGGALTLSGANIYSGGTAIQGGTSIFTVNATALGSGSVDIQDGRLDLDANLTVGSLKGIDVDLFGSDDAELILDAYTLTVNQTTAETFEGDISGSGKLVKAGSATLTLSGANVYSGGTEIRNGILIADSVDALGTGSVTIAGGTLELGTDVVIGSSLVAEAGLYGTSSAQIDLAGYNLTVFQMKSGSYAGTIQNSGSLTKDGSASLTLLGASTYSGGTLLKSGRLVTANANALGAGALVIVDGTLVLNANLSLSSLAMAADLDAPTDNAEIELGVYALTVNQNGDTEFVGDISGSGRLVKSGTGELTLSGDASTYVGGTEIQAGTLVANSLNALGGSTGTLTLSGGVLDMNYSLSVGTLSGTGGTIQLDGYSLTVNQAAAGEFAGTMTAGAGSQLIKNGSATLTLSGMNAYAGGTLINAGTLELKNVEATGTGNVAIGAGAVLSLNLNASGIFDNQVTGVGSLTKTGTATVTLTGDNGYLGGTLVTDGTLVADSLNALGSASGSLRLTGGTLDMNYNLSVGTLSGTGGTIQLDGKTLTVNQAANGEFAGTMTAGTGSQLIKNGSATLTLSGVNAYNGGTTISAGTLELKNVASAGTGSVLVLGGANLTLNTSGTFGNDITGGGSLTKTGTGTVSLTGTNSYVGGTYVNAGMLTVGDLALAGLAAGPVSVASGAILDINITAAETLHGAGITNNGVVRKSNTGTLTFDSLTAGTGGFQVKAGTLQFTAGNMSDATFGKSSIENGAWLEFKADDLDGTADGTATLTLGTRTIIQGGLSFDGRDASLNLVGNVTQTGGTLRLLNNASVTGDGTYTIVGSTGGGLWVDETIVVGNKIIATNGVAVTIDYDGVPKELDILLEGTASLSKRGAGVATVSVNHAYTGGTAIYEGVLKTGSLTALGTGPVVIYSEGQLELANDLNIGSLAGVDTDTDLIDDNELLLGNYTLTINQTSTATFAGDIAGSGGRLVKTGASALTLTGNNTYDGGTEIRAGTLVAESMTALGAGAVVINGGTLDLDAELAIGSLSGLGGKIQLDNVLTVNQTIGGAFSGTIAGAGSLVKTGTATLALNGAGSYDGGTVILGGVLQTGHLSALGTGAVVISGAQLDLNANLSIGSLAGDAAAAIQLDYQLTVNQTLDGPFAGMIAGAGSLVKTGAAILTLSHANSYTGGTTIAGGTLATETLTALGTGAVAVTGGTLDLDADLNIGSLSGNSGKIQLDNLLTVTQTTAGAFAGIITGSGSLVKSGTGTLTLSGNSDYSGTTTITSGTPTAANVLATASEHALGNSVVTLMAYSKLDLNASLTIGGLTGAAGTVQLDNFSLTIDQAAVEASFAGMVTGSGRLIKDGTGRLILSGTNTYSGGTIIADGSIRVDSIGALGTGSVSLDDGDLILNTNLTLGGVSLVDAGSTGEIDLNGRFLTLKGGTYAAPITGAGKVLVSSSTAVVTLTGASDYTGTTEITAGTVNLGNAAGFGDSTVKMTAGTVKLLTDAAISFTADNTNKGSVATNGRILTLDADAAAYYGGIISGTGSVKKTGLDKLTLAGLNTYTGGTIIEDGTLLAMKSTAIGTGSLAINGGTFEVGATMKIGSLSGNDAAAALKMNAFALTVNQTANGEFEGIISGSGKLTKTGAATLLLANANTYNGGTLIQAGTMIAGNQQALGTGAVALTGGVLDLNADLDISTLSGTAGAIRLDEYDLAISQSLAGSFAGSISGTGGLTKAGANTLTLSGANAYSGGTIIDGGILVTSKSSSLGSGSVTLTTGTLDLNAALSIGSLSGSTGTTLKLDTFALTINQTMDGTFSGAIKGSGALIKQGSGILTIDQDNLLYTGGTTIGGGTIVTTMPKSLGAGAVTLAGGTLDLDAALSIGSLKGSAGLVQMDDNLTVNQTVAGIYSGIISGAGILEKKGTATLTLTGASDYTGRTVISKGLLTTKSLTALGTGPVTLNGGTLGLDASLNVTDLSGTAGSMRLATSASAAVTLTVNQVADATYGGTIVGTNLNSDFFKDGAGVLTLNNATTSNTYAGRMTVRESELYMDGNLKNANFRVNDGATLRASERARMKAVVIDPSANFLVGRRAGSTSYAIVDSLTLRAGSTWEFSLDANKTLNLLAVTRTLTIESGVDLVLSGGDAGSSYTLVTFGTVAGKDNLTTDEGSLQWVGNKLLATVTSPAPATPAATAATPPPTIPSTPPVIPTAATPPPVYSSAQMAQALTLARSMVNPGVHIEGAQRTAIDATHQLNNTVSDRLDRLGSNNVEMAMLGAQKKNLQASRIGLLPSPVESDWGAWGSAMGSWGDRESSASSPGYTDSIYGGMVGLDRTFDEFIVGAYAGGFDNKVNGINDSRLDITSAMLGLYGRYDSKDNLWYAVGGASYGQNDYKAKSMNASSNFDGYQYSLYGEAGLKLVLDAWYLTPALAAQYTHIDTDNYQLGNVLFDGTNKDSLLGLAILKGGRWFQTPWGTGGRAELRLAYQNEMMSDEGGSSMSLANMPGATFTMRNDELARDAIHMGCGVNANINDQWSVGVDYDFEIRNNYTRHSGSLTLRYEF